jgi:hypothetical protein
VGAVASNAVPWLGLTGAVHAITITNTPNWTTVDGTNKVLISTQGSAITNLLALSATNAGSATIRVTVQGGQWSELDIPQGRFYSTYGGGSTQTIYTSGNFSPSTYLTIAAYQSAITNSLQIYSGTVTQDQIGILHRGFYSGTNLWIPVGGTNWLRFGGVLNAW